MITKTLDQTSDGDRAAPVRFPRRPSARRNPSMRESFADDITGSDALSTAVADAARAWGVGWAAERAAHVARGHATWLLNNDPKGGYLALVVEYDPRRRELAIIVGDDGSMVPALASSDEWLHSLGPVTAAEAQLDSGSHRALCCVVKVRSPWRLRLTWNTGAMLGTHPKNTYEGCETREDADRVAAAHLARIGTGVTEGALRAVSWQGPEHRDDEWYPCDVGGEG